MNEGGAYVALTDLARELQRRPDGYRLAVALVEFVGESTHPCQDLAAVLDLPEEKVEAIYQVVRERRRKAMLAGQDQPNTLRPRLFLVDSKAA